MLDEIYYTFKLSELLMVESDLEEYIANNPLISTGIFLNNFPPFKFFRKVIIPWMYKIININTKII